MSKNYRFIGGRRKINKQRSAIKKARKARLLELIPGDRVLTARDKAEIARQIGVSVRTINTYLQDFERENVCPYCKQRLDPIDNGTD